MYNSRIIIVPIMSTNMVSDIQKMYDKYGFNTYNFSEEKLNSFLDFRVKFIEEELSELKSAIEQRDKSEVVDAIIDIIVVAIGTLHLFDVDIHKAWDEVLKTNLMKKVGEKDTRKNNFGFPDLIKPEGWISPTHSDNTGRL